MLNESMLVVFWEGTAHQKISVYSTSGEIEHNLTPQQIVAPLVIAKNVSDRIMSSL